MQNCGRWWILPLANYYINSDRLCLELRQDCFERFMPVMLADNGSEFSNPAALESDPQGGRRIRLFYCDPSAPYE